MKVVAGGDNLPKLGLVITQKNEAAILSHNIQYHRYMGVSNFYIFDDGSSDKSMDTVPDTEGIYKFFETDFSSIPIEMNTIKQKALGGSWMGCQILNTYKALVLAKKHGVDWLFFIDADELVYLGTDEKDSFRNSFAEVDSHIDVVHFNKVYEVAQNGKNDEHVFKSCIYFKTAEYNTNCKREILDPIENKMITLEGFFGHNGGKQAARVNKDLIPISAHTFKKRNGDTVEKLDLGQIMHYQLSSFKEFMKQNSIRHPSHFIYGKEVPYYPKMFWRHLVIDSGFNIEELRKYYEQWIMFSDEEIERLLKESNDARPLLIEFKKISEILNSIEAA